LSFAERVGTRAAAAADGSVSVTGQYGDCNLFLVEFDSPENLMAGDME